MGRRKLLASEVRIFEVAPEGGSVAVSVYGGAPSTCTAISIPLNEVMVGVAIRWWDQETALDLFLDEESEQLTLREHVYDTTPRPNTDTQFSRFKDGYEQGQRDVLGLIFRRPLPFRKRNPSDS